MGSSVRNTPFLIPTSPRLWSGWMNFLSFPFPTCRELTHSVLGASYNMDHEVLLRPCKICDWVLNLSRDHLGLHQGKSVRVTMEFKVSKRHILRPTLSTDMVQRVLRWELAIEVLWSKKGKDP